MILKAHTPYKDWFSYNQVGVVIERWYATGLGSNGNPAFSTLIMTPNTLRAHALFLPRGGTIDRIGINVTAAVAGDVRIGLYSSLSDTNLYPGELITDFGVLSTAFTGVQSFNLIATPVKISPWKLYWLAINFSANPTVRSVGQLSMAPILGLDAGLGTVAGYAWSQALAIAPMTNPYPAGASAVGGTGPVIAYRLFA